VATNLKWIGEKARKEPDLVFTSLYHHILDVDNLRASYDILKADKAIGVDGVTKQQYGRDLENNAKRRSYIPKAGSTKGRALGISNLEDKIVEASVKRTLEPIYESDPVAASTSVLMRWVVRSSANGSTMWWRPTSKGSLTRSTTSG